MVGHDGYGWLGKGMKYYATAEDARRSMYPDNSEGLVEQDNSEELVEQSEALWDSDSGLPLPEAEEVIRVTQFVNEALLSKLRSNPEELFSFPPRKFEELVAELFVREGFSVELTPESRDGGYDVIAVRYEHIGNIKYLTECKRYRPDRKVGVEIVRSLFGVLTDDDATRAMVATTSSFTRGAKEFATKYKWRLGLKDYEDLKTWIDRTR